MRARRFRSLPARLRTSGSPGPKSAYILRSWPRSTTPQAVFITNTSLTTGNLLTTNPTFKSKTPRRRLDPCRTHKQGLHRGPNGINCRCAKTALPADLHRSRPQPASGVKQGGLGRANGRWPCEAPIGLRQRQLRERRLDVGPGRCRRPSAHSDGKRRRSKAGSPSVVRIGRHAGLPQAGCPWIAAIPARAGRNPGRRRLRDRAFRGLSGFFGACASRRSEESSNCRTSRFPGRYRWCHGRSSSCRARPVAPSGQTASPQTQTARSIRPSALGSRFPQTVETG